MKLKRGIRRRRIGWTQRLLPLDTFKMFPNKNLILLFGASLALGVSGALAQYSSAREMILDGLKDSPYERSAREAREKELQLELLEYEANERKLEMQSRQEMLKMESLKRKDGTSAFLELTTLDPTSEEYPAKEASILAKYPLAISDLEVRSLLKANANDLNERHRALGLRHLGPPVILNREQRKSSSISKPKNRPTNKGGNSTN